MSLSDSDTSSLRDRNFFNHAEDTEPVTFDSAPPSEWEKAEILRNKEQQTFVRAVSNNLMIGVKDVSENI